MPRNLAHRLRAGLAAALLGTLVAVVPGTAARATPTAQQGIQLGDLLDLGRCTQMPSVDRYLNSADAPALQAATNWLRMDFRGAGGNPGCDPTAAYAGIIGAARTNDTGLKIIGVLTKDFVLTDNDADWNNGNFPTVAQAYANAAAALVCNPGFSHVTVWEIWNEEGNFSFVPAAKYADLLLRTVHAIRACGTVGRNTKIITGGLQPGDSLEPPPPSATGCDGFCYLDRVNSAIAGAHDPTYPTLASLVNGVGIHPYVDPFPPGTPLHQPLQAFLSAYVAHGYTSLYVTEFGWRTDVVDFDTQCANLTRAFMVIKSNYGSYVKAATWYDQQDPPNGEQYGIYRSDFTPKPAYTGYTTGTCPAPCPPPAPALARPAVTPLDGVCPIPPPAAPSGPSAIATSGSAIRLSWADNSFNETGFDIYNGVTTVSVGANTTTYTWGGLAQGTYMCFAVRAANSGGASAWTPYACATTPTVPSAPTGQWATAISTSSIRVDWRDTSNNETGFQVNNGVSTVTLGANATTYTWGGLAQGTYMCFAVRSINVAGASAWTPWTCTSSLVSGGPPAAPTGLTAAPLGSTAVLLQWTDNATNETQYSITNGTLTFGAGPNSTSFAWPGLTSHTYMCFAVKAVNGAGSSPWTPWACTTTP